MAVWDQLRGYYQLMLYDENRTVSQRGGCHWPKSHEALRPRLVELLISFLPCFKEIYQDENEVTP